MNKFSQFLFAIVIGLVAMTGLVATATAHEQQFPRHVLAKMDMQCRAEGGMGIEVRYGRPTCVMVDRQSHRSYGPQRYGYQSQRQHQGYGQRRQPIVNLSLQWQWGGNRQRQQNRHRRPPPPRHYDDRR